MPSKRFTRKFYQQDSVTVAKRLLGCYLHRVVDGEELIGRIVETEAYSCFDDESCHAFRGKTPRNAIMFEEGGYSYVYFTYGMHHCFNVTTNAEGIAEAVLIRALEPVQGIETMKKLRAAKMAAPRELTNGPGKLCQALHLTRQDNGLDLVESDELFIAQGKAIEPNLLGTSTRIGINVAKHHPWRFFINGNEYVSRGKPSV
jgi:DNA-3-methyladenine glycosylase